MPDANGDLQEVFLDRRRLIPVPLFYWKIIQDPDVNEAIVFVGVNSPRSFDVDEVPPELLICPDICESAGWNFPNKNETEKGFLYCCSYQSFKESIQWIDFFDSAGILNY